MKPSIVRMVHYVTPDQQHHAAMVVYVSDGDRCNLVIWNEFGGQYFHEEAAFDPTATIPGTWHWPEKVEEAPTLAAETVGSTAGNGAGLPSNDQNQRK